MSSRFAIGAAVAHLFLVALGAAHPFDWNGLGLSGRLVGMYGSASGAGSSYGFFAPSVATHLKASFEITETNNQVRIEPLGGRADREVDLRLGNIVSVFWDEVEDENSRRAIAASWAGNVLGRHPGAKKVKLILESYDLPSINEFREGKVPGWEPFYTAAFIRES